MKVRLPVMIKDKSHGEFYSVPLTENWELDDEEFFLDGPVTKRVAVLDFDPDTGQLAEPVAFHPPEPGKTIGRYDVPVKIASDEELSDPKCISVCAFSAVLRTMRMFESADVLGRQLTWGFDSPQLFIIPRAGNWENAFYERESRSLQFFYFQEVQEGTVAGQEKIFYTSLSNDIVTHETGHAILDGIAPDLYHAITPQSLALHEAVADLVAVVMAFRSKKLSQAILDKNKGSIKNSNAFSGLAKGFESARHPHVKERYLRNLRNKLRLDQVPNHDPHELSMVLSGALYSIVFQIHEDWKKRLAKGDASKLYSVSGKALAVATDQFKRQIFRALDYLPPGEVSFADFARAIIAADQSIYPDYPAERDLIAKEFVKRKIVKSLKDLAVKTNYEEPAVSNLDLKTLVESDWAAYEFANTHRELLGIPAGIHFRVRARVLTAKVDRTAGGRANAAVEPNGIRHECLFKVSWDHKEPNNVPGLPAERQLTVGTTLVIDWETKQVRAKLTAEYGSAEQIANRDAMLNRLLDEGILRVGERAIGPDGNVLQSAVQAEVMGGLMRVRGMARMLHICGEEHS